MSETQTKALLGEWIERALQGNRRAVGRLITVFERNGPEVEAIVKAIYPRSGHAYVIGLTGPPGAGKSTVVDDFLRVLRSQHLSVGVLAVDPNSPFSGGAVLGDRVRMMRHSQDPEVYIRSMGARGHLGGLAVAAQNAILLMDAMGKDVILVETVGVGQSELEVAGASDTTIVVIPPGLGDGIQAIKAGIMEIADVFVVNKADNPYAEKTVTDIRDLLRMELSPQEWTPPIVKTVATTGEGIPDLWLRVQQHRAFLERAEELEERRRDRLQREILAIAERRLLDEVLAPRMESEQFHAMLEKTLRRELDPYQVADAIVPRRRAASVS